MKVKIKKLNKNAVVPKYATKYSAGVDLIVSNFKSYILYRSNGPVGLVDGGSFIDLMPNDRLLVGCGFSLAIPTGYELQIRSRSGNAIKQGLIVLNSPGTIDSDYRGEIGVILINKGGLAVRVNIGDKVAQAVLSEYKDIVFTEVEELDETERGEGGFGSTDIKT